MINTVRDTVRGLGVFLFAVAILAGIEQWNYLNHSRSLEDRRALHGRLDAADADRETLRAEVRLIEARLNRLSERIDQAMMMRSPPR